MISKELREMTVSNLFIVPLLQIGRQFLNDMGLINSFLYNKEEEMEYGNVIHLLFCPPDMELFNDFIFIQREKESIVDEKDYPGGFVLVTYHLPEYEQLKKDYDLIREGKYSKVSSEYKRSIPAVVKFYHPETKQQMTDISIQHMVFQKYEPLRRSWEDFLGVVIEPEQELWEQMSEERETFTLEKLQKPIKNDKSPTRSTKGVRKP